MSDQDTGREWQGVIRWGGAALLVAGAIVFVFITLVVARGQTLPVPAAEALEAPGFPAMLFIMVELGELLLLPGALALFFHLAAHGRSAMLIAVAIQAISTVMFLASRSQFIAIWQISDRFAAATTPAEREVLLAVADFAIEKQNVYSTTGVLLLCAVAIITGAVMLKSPMPRWIAWTVILSGVLSAFTPFAVILGVPGIVPFAGLILMGLWQIVVGSRMLARPQALGAHG